MGKKIKEWGGKGKSMWSKKELLDVKIDFLMHAIKLVCYYEKFKPLWQVNTSVRCPDHSPSSVQLMLLSSSSIRFSVSIFCHLPYISPDIIFVKKTRPKWRASSIYLRSKKNSYLGRAHSGRNPNSVLIRRQRKRVFIRKEKGTITTIEGRHFSAHKLTRWLNSKPCV